MGFEGLLAPDPWARCCCVSDRRRHLMAVVADTFAGPTHSSNLAGFVGHPGLCSVAVASPQRRLQLNPRALSVAARATAQLRPRQPLRSLPCHHTDAPTPQTVRDRHAPTPECRRRRTPRSVVEASHFEVPIPGTDEVLVSARKLLISDGEIDGAETAGESPSRRTATSWLLHRLRVAPACREPVDPSRRTHTPCRVPILSGTASNHRVLSTSTR